MAKKVKIRDKERTKSKLLKAVGSILSREGHNALKINRISAVSGINKKLIYDYYKGVDGLIMAYLQQVDFWKIESEKYALNKKEQLPLDVSKSAIFSILKNDFEYLENSPEMQRIILWGISEKNKTIRTLTDEREAFGKIIFKESDKKFKKSPIDFRALNAIFVSAIYYIVLHGHTNGSTICEIDVTSLKGKERILNCIEDILDWAYDKAVAPSK